MNTETKSAAPPLGFRELMFRIENDGICCDQGERVPCVCRVSVRCPTHGLICVGTHD